LTSEQECDILELQKSKKEIRRITKIGFLEKMKTNWDDPIWSMVLLNIDG